jgi:hypothetical protein
MELVGAQASTERALSRIQSALMNLNLEKFFQTTITDFPGPVVHEIVVPICQIVTALTV